LDWATLFWMREDLVAIVLSVMEKKHQDLLESIKYA